MTEKSFFGPEWDLANIAANTASRDAFLADLIELTENGFGTPIGILTNGMIVLGMIATPRSLAEELDLQRQARVEGLEQPDDVSAEDWAERLQHWATANTRAYERAVQQQEEVDEKVEASGEGPWDYSTQPRGLPREALDVQIRTMVTLANAQLVAPGQPGVTTIKVLRVALNQISGWWPIPVDEEGKASFRLFVSDGE